MPGKLQQSYKAYITRVLQGCVFIKHLDSLGSTTLRKCRAKRTPTADGCYVVIVNMLVKNQLSQIPAGFSSLLTMKEAPDLSDCSETC